MDWKIFCTRFTGLILVALLAGPVYAITVNLLVFANLIPTDIEGKEYGSLLTTRAIYVWMGCVVLSFASLFIKENWRSALYLSPLFAPSVFATVFTLAQR